MAMPFQLGDQRFLFGKKLHAKGNVALRYR
ncbi:hypothetical protein GGD62_001569 [Bradyrhizobium sp. ERR14]|nr:hypothetical protein [Bradyrhizobium sp. ERR14]